ncbi:MAG: hypothetical protein NUV81_03715 [bacterium]|nr:hypothetical protein [bacterium]
MPVIKKERVLHASNSPFEYTGSGVYCGVLGCYANWSDTAFRFKLPMADSYPSVRLGGLESLAPVAMANMLSEKLHLPQDADKPAEAMGAKFWSTGRFSKKIPSFVFEILSNEGFRTTKQPLKTTSAEALIFEDDVSPIIIGTICQCLGVDFGIARKEIKNFQNPFYVEIFAE